MCGMILLPLRIASNVDPVNQKIAKVNDPPRGLWTRQPALPAPAFPAIVRLGRVVEISPDC